LFFFLIGFLSKKLSNYAKDKKIWITINILIIVFMSALTLKIFFDIIDY